VFFFQADEGGDFSLGVDSPGQKAKRDRKALAQAPYFTVVHLNEECGPVISHQLLRDEGILIVSPRAPLLASDFQEVACEVDPYIEEKGKLNGLRAVELAHPHAAEADGGHAQAVLAQDALIHGRSLFVN
jgi:hypothetical protein